MFSTVSGAVAVNVIEAPLFSTLPMLLNVHTDLPFDSGAYPFATTVYFPDPTGRANFPVPETYLNVPLANVAMK